MFHMLHQTFKELEFISSIKTMAGPPEQGGQRGRQPLRPPSPPPPPKLSVDVPFFADKPLMWFNPLNVLFLKEITKNIHENQQATSRAS